MKTYATEIPKDSLITKALDRIDYQDAFGVIVPIRSEELLVKMPLLFFKVFPSWFRGLMYIREALARIAGLKTATDMDVGKQLREFKGEVGQSIAVFHVMGRNETELLTGENDSHLDFRLSFFAIPKAENQTELILATTVKFNGWMGKAYFIPVGPIHRQATPLLLKRIAKALVENQQAIQPTS